jgi:hypothetical protein
MSLDRLKQDSILSQARTVVAPATDLHNDANSRSYSKARVSLENGPFGGHRRYGRIDLEEEADVQQLVPPIRLHSNRHEKR